MPALLLKPVKEGPPVDGLPFSSAPVFRPGLGSPLLSVVSDTRTRTARRFHRFLFLPFAVPHAGNSAHKHGGLPPKGQTKEGLPADGFPVHFLPGFPSGLGSPLLSAVSDAWIRRFPGFHGFLFLPFAVPRAGNSAHKLRRPSSKKPRKKGLRGRPSGFLRARAYAGPGIAVIERCFGRAAPL
jgi:hypothetical protein